MRIPRARKIEDPLANTNISKQRKWQLRNTNEGKCNGCGDDRDYWVLMKPKEGKPYKMLLKRCKRCTVAINKRRRDRYNQEKGN